MGRERMVTPVHGRADPCSGTSGGTMRAHEAGIRREMPRTAERPCTGQPGGSQYRTGSRTPWLEVALLLDAGLLATQVAQVVQLGATDVTTGDDLDRLDRRAVEREGPLDTDAVADLADREGLARTTALAADDHALEDLDTAPRAFSDADVHLERVTRAERRGVGTHRGLLDLLDQGVHDCVSSALTEGRPRA